MNKKKIKSVILLFMLILFITSTALMIEVYEIVVSVHGEILSFVVLIFPSLR